MTTLNTIQKTARNAPSWVSPFLWLLAAASVLSHLTSMLLHLPQAMAGAMLAGSLKLLGLFHGASTYGWRGIVFFVVVCLGVSNAFEMHRSKKFMRVRFLSLALLGIFGAIAQGQSVHELFGTDRFHRAYTETSEVTFEQFQELAWEARARAALPWLNLDRPTPPQIARLSASESAGPQYRSVDFRSPLDPSVRRATYLLISADDVVPVTPVELKGTASFDFDPGMTAVTRRTITGTVVGKASHAVTTAAFVVVGKPDDVKDARPGAKFEKRRPAGPAVYDFTDGSRTVTWTPLSKEQPDAASAFSFRLAGQQLLLVKWKPEVCESSYTLFSVDAALKPIASNDYDCDT